MKEIRYPEWQAEYLAAVEESDVTQLAAKAMEAEEAIFRRLQTLGTDSNHHQERLALDEAILALYLLRRDKLNFPDWK